MTQANQDLPPMPAASDSLQDAERLYTWRFAQVFVAIMLFMTAVALQFHFGQYISFLGHGVDVLGRMLSVSMVGTICIRLSVGRWIDRIGCKPMWLAGALMFTVVTGSMQFVSDVYVITLLRAIGAMAMAAALTTMTTFAAKIAPQARRAESIGSLGLAGLTGIMVGPTLGDVIFSEATASARPYHVFFTASAACSLASCVVIALLQVSDDRHPHTASETRSQWRVIKSHWPGLILLLSITFSMVFTLQASFIERLAGHRGFDDIKLFFLIYSPTAVTLRIIFRRLPQQIGRQRTMLIGLMFLASGVYCLIGIDSQTGLILPGLLMGAGHCFTWPSMVDLAADHLPAHHRGTGTSLVLGAGDIGMLVGFVVLGESFDAYGFDPTLTALSLTVVAGTALYTIVHARTLFGRQ